ncbi:tail fiber domain-containing protein [Shewanella japonica]|uniref:tail fiber domain-containing protein n=1 Tax=Shewanella japonica TaxID=93973 RepID=UPI0024950F51|nr:tail fiber domain-containing protein [Shewanella japonica]
MKKTKYKALAFLSFPMMVSPLVFADNQILDDLIVTQSACIGQDCVNGESFGFDTIRLKENNLRIKFDDTSNSASFPNNDWQITINDSDNGGANKFSIDDVTSGRTPFTIEAAAPNHSLYVDDGGRIGVGTSTPIVEMHVVNGDSPTLRLEQNGSSGFTAQTWDLAGNETNFFVRDVTNGSKLPFKIRPGAPTNSVYVDTDGDVGMGTASPDAQLHVIGQGVLISDADNGAPASGLKYLHVVGEDGSAHIERDSNTTAATTMLNLTNNGVTRLEWNNSATGNQWKMTNHEDDFYIITPQSPDAELVLSKAGDLTITGALNAGGVNYPSSRALKENFSKLELSNLLEKVSNLNISQWNYIKDTNKVVHIGPIAEEFHQAFGLNGQNDAVISTSDIAGVSLAAIQALKLELDKSKAEIQKLKQLIQNN